MAAVMALAKVQVLEMQVRMLIHVSGGAPPEQTAKEFEPDVKRQIETILRAIGEHEAANVAMLRALGVDLPPQDPSGAAKQ